MAILNPLLVIVFPHYKGKKKKVMQIQNVQIKELILYSKPKALHFILYTPVLKIIFQFTILTHRK